MRLISLFQNYFKINSCCSKVQVLIKCTKRESLLAGYYSWYSQCFAPLSCSTCSFQLCLISSTESCTSREPAIWDQRVKCFSTLANSTHLWNRLFAVEKLKRVSWCTFIDSPMQIKRTMRRLISGQEELTFFLKSKIKLSSKSTSFKLNWLVKMMILMHNKANTWIKALWCWTKRLTSKLLKLTIKLSFKFKLLKKRSTCSHKLWTRWTRILTSLSN